MNVTTEHQHRARKRFGQNFLHDNSVISKIIMAINPQEDEAVIEIGPGTGAITRELVKHKIDVTVVEIDRDLAKNISREFGHIKVINEDVLKTDLSLLASTQTVKLAGNLPYNISTPLLFRLVDVKHCFNAMYFMLQKEVVDRMIAKKDNKTYGRLGVMLQYHFHVSHQFDIHPEAFKPRPKVMSSFVRLEPREPEVLAVDEALFGKVVNCAFQQRRKTLKNSLSTFLKDKNPEGFGSLLEKRAENLSVNEFVQLSNHFAQQVP
jgi:16S rRNA (adenine1518-N6/adenine1519-N6)-dimethyltransferase